MFPTNKKNTSKIYEFLSENKIRPVEAYIGYIYKPVSEKLYNYISTAWLGVKPTNTGNRKGEKAIINL